MNARTHQPHHSGAKLAFALAVLILILAGAFLLMGKPHTAETVGERIDSTAAELRNDARGVQGDLQKGTRELRDDLR